MSEWNWCRGAQNAAVSVKPQDRGGGWEGGRAYPGGLAISHSQQLCKIIGTRKFLHKKRVQSPQDCLEHQHGPSFIVLEHQLGRHDVV